MSPDETEAAAPADAAPEPAAAPPTPAPAPPSGTTRGRRKIREGLVTSVAMQSTAVVSVTERVRHRRYAKTVQQTKKLYVHDADNEARLGDRVRVMETRPVSRTKRWRLLEIVERAR
ncbi:MAG TPA: 30S ribosomal protein S17 [Acidimicrobiaceae bacterium]|nr:30S ribosomal protein S17 [Acidimicrobiaceae bacterium]